MISALFSTGIFGFLTITYFLSKFFFVDRHKGPKGMIGKILGIFYLVLVIGAQLMININNSKELCNGAPQVVTAMIYTIIPNFLILGLIMMLLTILPGWKAPFSNTIGYFFVYMAGINNVFTDLLRTKGSELVQKIYDNKSIIINEITPFNFDMFLSTMNKDHLLKSGYKNKDAFHKLWGYVVAKDSIAEFVWIFLTGALVISTTYNALLEITCNIPTAHRKAIGVKFEAEMAESNAKKPKEKLFTVHD